MATKQAPRTYSYHFLNSESNNERPFSSHLENSQLAIKYNRSAYKFFGEFQENVNKSMSSEADLSKFAALKEKVIHPTKKYTFSGLTKHTKDFRKTEDFEVSAEVASASKASMDIERQVEVSQPHKKSIENQEELLFESYVKPELKTESSTENNIFIKASKIDQLQQKIEELTIQNELLRVRADQYKKLNQEHEQALNRLNCELKSAYETIGRQAQEIDDLNKCKQQNKTEIIELQFQIEEKKKQKPSLNFICEVFQEMIWLQKPTKENKDQQTSLSDKVFDQKSKSEKIDKTFEEEYKQIVSLFGFEISQDNCHEILISFILETQKNIEELHHHRGKIQNFDKDKNKLHHTLKKHEAEISRLCQDNNFLSQELSKNINLLSNANDQITLLNLKTLEYQISLKNMY